MKLPNAENAIIEIAKLRDYSLNPDHSDGKHKARVFLDKLGLIRNDAEQLRQLLLERVLTAEAVEQEPTQYGRRFVIDLQISWPKGFVISTAAVRTAWIIRNDEDFPRMTTCFCL